MRKKVVSLIKYQCKHREDIKELGKQLEELIDTDNYNFTVYEDPEYHHLYILLANYVKNKNLPFETRALALRQIYKCSALRRLEEELFGIENVRQLEKTAFNKTREFFAKEGHLNL